MPIIKSAKKRVKVGARNRALNLGYKKKIQEAIKKHKEKPSKKTLTKVFSIVDKAAKKKVIHKNKAARIKSRMSKFTKVPKDSKNKKAKK